MGRRFGTLYSDEYEQSFLNRVRQLGGHWEWTGKTNLPGKGPQANGPKGGRISARLISYDLYVGAVEDGYRIKATCNHPLCVNPEHLEQVPTERKTGFNRTFLLGS